MKKKPRKKAATARRGSASRAKPSKRASGPALKVGSEVWPLERDVLFRPDRFKYVRKLVKTEGCVFCTAAEAAPSFETLCVYQTDQSMIILNKFPYNSGHLLVLPRCHCGDLLKLESDDYTDLMATLKLGLQALEEVYQPGGVNAGLNHGAVAGAGIPDHLHFHLIPRWSGDLNFFPLIADTKVVIESLEQTWDRLRTWFQTRGGRPE